MLQARLIAYQDAQRYRVGVNHNQLPMNAPRCPVHHYQRDGVMAGFAPTNQDDSVNFYPNDQDDAAKPDSAYMAPPLPLLEDAWVGSYSQDDEDYFEQAGDLFRLLPVDEKNRLAGAIASGLCQAEESVQERMLGYFANTDAGYARRVRQAMT